jgi:hypothetical protein
MELEGAEAHFAPPVPLCTTLIDLIVRPLTT